MEDLKDIIFERKVIAGHFNAPLRLTRLGPADLGQHIADIRPLLKLEIRSYPAQQAAVEQCWTRLINTFKWN